MGCTDLYLMIHMTEWDAHDDGTSASDNDDEDGLHIPILEKEHKPIFEGSETTLLSTIVFLVNLKVMNSLSHVTMSLC